MLEFLSYGFMQRAFLASLLIALVCSTIGVFAVLRGITFIGAGTAHAAFAGVCFAFLAGIPPFPMAVTFGLSTVWVTNYVQEKGKMNPDVPIGVFYTFTMALAILFIGLMEGYRPEVFAYLFGSILSVSPSDLVVILILSVGILLIMLLFFKEFHFISFDQEMAEASGIPAKRLNFLLLNLISLAVVIALKAVGAILVFALLVIPAAAAQQWAKNMRSMMIYSALIGVGASWAGVLFSYWFDVPSGATIVLIAAAIFLFSVLFSGKRRGSIRIKGY
ncbi:Zinc ABC transporter, inner membrane permease protein ZnuB [hydrothermal vent metagenome]|uniref:Zinc ABC transporter, inner membrane permease protein ZnuB n=1 Tax=hydrothermal vent metagenome TaxID=652676 RepID=A0A3B1CUE1_9ZZZZ